MMSYDQVSALLERYWDGDTSVEEERSLKNYFNDEPVDERLQYARPLFAAIQTEQKTQLTRTNIAHLQPKGGVWRRRLMAAATVAGLLGFGAWGVVRYQTEQERAAALTTDTYEDPQKAAEEIKAALALVSSKLKKGKKAAAKGLQKVEAVDKYIIKPKHIH